MDRICKNCKYWSEERLKLCGIERENFRLCKKGKIKEWTYAYSCCDDSRYFKKKRPGIVDKIFLAIVITIYVFCTLVIMIGTATYGF